jgi:hypothetical protein
MDMQAQAIFYACPCLRTVDISYNKWLSNSGLRALAFNCRYITNLNLSGCKRISDAGVEDIANNCSYLQKLGLFMCTAITDDCLNAISSGLSELTSISLGGNRKISSAGVHLILSRCRLLYSATFYQCIQLTDIFVFPRNLFLRFLNISRCYCVTNNFISSIVESFPNLEEIDLSYCNEITDFALQLIATKCNDLKLLDVRGCEKVSSYGVEQLNRCYKLYSLKSWACTQIN